MTGQDRKAPSPQEPGLSRTNVMTSIEFDDDLLYPDDDDNPGYDSWNPSPEWRQTECAGQLPAQEQGARRKYPMDALVSRTVELAEAIERALRGCAGGAADCARTAQELARLLASVPGLVEGIRAALPAADRLAAARLLCPVGRLILLGLELEGRPGCPWACGDHGQPGRRAEVTPLISLLEDCDEALWTVVLPRRRRPPTANTSAPFG